MPYNNPIKKKDSACKQLKSETGKPSGLMMEGSVAYQEETKKVEEAKAKKLDKEQEIKAHNNKLLYKTTGLFKTKDHDQEFEGSLNKDFTKEALIRVKLDF